MARKLEKTDIFPALPSTPPDKGALRIEGLRQNNLKNISLTIPHNSITAIVGPSGSGKSSLAFDTLFAEGRWRFMESLSTYTRLFLERMDRPDLDRIQNIRPAIAIEQKNPVRTSRSTVGTATEINDHLRVLLRGPGTSTALTAAYP
ncbi:MAG: ATP-binding cassette domain-containing protein [Deltaproteobacteria bacterium]|nr:ATP-binding cassette domain-containing protein [Deltaproteobacteria bacterium]